jgi:hypothetical protein
MAGRAVRFAATAIMIGALGCGSGTQGAGPSNAAGAGSSTRPPPAGFIAPQVGSLRLAWYWGDAGDATWQAIYDVDGHDPRVASIVEGLQPGDNLDLGDIGLGLYRDQLRGAGIHLTDDDTMLLAYEIRAGALVVTVRSDDSNTSGDHRAFYVWISVPGG